MSTAPAIDLDRCQRFARANGIDPHDVLQAPGFTTIGDRIHYAQIVRGSDGRAVPERDGSAITGVKAVAASMPLLVRWDDIPPSQS